MSIQNEVVKTPRSARSSLFVDGLKQQFSESENKYEFVLRRCTLILVFLSLTAYFPLGYSPSYSGHQAIDFLIAGLSLPVVVFRLRKGQFRTQAIFGILFLCLSLYSALTSGEDYIGIFGHYAIGEGWIFQASLIGGWALGLSFFEDEKCLSSLLKVIVVAALINVFVQIVQNVGLSFNFHLPGIGIQSNAGAPGLMGDPVYLAPLLVSALIIALSTESLSTIFRFGTILMLSVGILLTGDKLAMLFFIAISGYLFLKISKVKLFQFITMLTGAVAGYGITLLSPSNSVIARTSSSTVSFAVPGRIQLWKLGISAAQKKLLFGYGPGGVVRAVMPLSDFLTTRTTSLIANVHDIVLNYLVETGIVGLLLISLFFIIGIIKGKGTLLLISLVLLSFTMIEPTNLGITPVMFVALGASALRRKRLPEHKLSISYKIVSLVSLFVSVILALSILVADDMLELSQKHLLEIKVTGSTVNLNNEYVKILNEVAPYTSISAQDYAQYYAFRASLGQKSLYVNAIDEMKIAISRDPANPFLWSILAVYESAEGNLVLAENDYKQALKWFPNWPPSISGLCSVEHTLKQSNYEYYCKIKNLENQNST